MGRPFMDLRQSWWIHWNHQRKIKWILISCFWLRLPNWMGTKQKSLSRFKRCLITLLNHLIHLTPKCWKHDELIIRIRLNEILPWKIHLNCWIICPNDQRTLIWKISRLRMLWKFNQPLRTLMRKIIRPCLKIP